MAGFGQPLIILLAALVTGSEKVDGQLRSTLLAASRRSQILVIKCLFIAAGVTVFARSFIVALVILVPLVLGLTISVLGIFPF